MASTQERSDAIKDLAPSLGGLHPDAQSEAIRATIGEPDSSTTNLLWTILIPGLVALTGLALIGLIVLSALGKSADQAVTAFTALLTGLIGFFAPSPVGGKEKQNGGA
jgi:hypothetical protein